MIEGEAARAVPGLIQTALAPMFLLTAIGATLSVIDTRLNRIVDRARALDARMAVEDRHSVEIKAEADHFLNRATKLANAAALCIMAALAVALVVVLIFIDLQVRADLFLAVEAAFIVAVLLYVGALVIYLRDVLQVRTGLEYVRKRLTRHDSSPE